MNKGELINSIADKGGLMKKDAAKALDALLSTIVDSVESGEKVSIIGFGSFESRTRGQRKGRNPQTMEEIIIPPSKVPAFKPGKMFKDRINK